MKEYITIEKSDFDLLKSKAEKYDRGELSKEMEAEYNDLKKEVSKYNADRVKNISREFYIRNTLDHISYCLYHDKTFISGSDFDLLSLMINEVLGSCHGGINKSNFDYSDIRGIEDGINSTKKYLKDKLFMSKGNKKKISDLLDNLFYLAIDKCEKTNQNS